MAIPRTELASSFPVYVRNDPTFVAIPASLQSVGAGIVAIHYNRVAQFLHLISVAGVHCLENAQDLHLQAQFSFEALAPVTEIEKDRLDGLNLDAG